MKVSEGTLRGPKGIHGGACNVWNYKNKWEICVKVDKGKFANELSLLQIDNKNVGIICKTRQSSILIAKVDRLKFAGGPSGVIVWFWVVLGSPWGLPGSV